MLVVQDAFHNTDLPRGGVAAIGNFDGVHRGQQSVLEHVRRRAAELEAPSIAITFEPHPLAVVRPEVAPERLTTAGRKVCLLEDLGMDVVLVVDFNQELARTPARTFVRGFLHDRLEVAEVYVGSSFVFGHQREGNLELLQEMGDELGFAAAGLEQVRWEGERISSTRIRTAISEGRVEDAEEMLGRPYSIGGEVVRGDRMGQKLGWPTINLATEDQILPMNGVYAGAVHFPGIPSTFDCVTNIGTRPTVYENYKRVVESHVLDFDSDVYGQQVDLAFHKHLREEKIFPTVMDLSAQIGRDVDATREHAAARRRRAELETDAP